MKKELKLKSKKFHYSRKHYEFKKQKKEQSKREIKIKVKVYSKQEIKNYIDELNYV